jgi:hypothetical protein
MHKEIKDIKNWLFRVREQKSTLYDNDKCSGLNRCLYKDINLENLINNVSKNIYDLL